MKAKNDLITYKGYHIRIRFDAESDCLIADVIGTNDSISADGQSVREVTKNIQNNIDLYLEMCKKYGDKPDREYSGAFNVRIKPSTHKKVAIAAAKQNITLNQYVSDILDAAVR